MTLSRGRPIFLPVGTYSDMRARWSAAGHTRRSTGPILLCVLWVAGAAVFGCAAVSASPRGDRTFQQIQSTSVGAARAKVLGVLTSGRGNLLVLGKDSGDSLFVRYAVSSQTREALYRNQVETIDKGDSLFVTIRASETSTIDLQVEGPEDLRVQLYDEGRDIVVRNIENRVDVVVHSRGSLDLDDIEGPLTVKDGSGPMRIHDVRGPIGIQDEGGGLEISDVKNSLRVDARSGDVTIENVGGDVNLTLGAGTLTVRDVTGTLTYHKCCTGKVTIERVAGGVVEL